MAIFETTSETNSILDDTEKLICTVENAQNINKHTEYIMRVQRGVNKENKWTVSRRYRDFAALHSNLQQSNINLHLPPKKLIGNMQPAFIAERQIGLQNYINEVLKHEILALSLQVRSFLDPINYSLDIEEQALQTVSIALRGDGRYELKGPLPRIGWRIRKHYFLVTDISSKTNCILSWQRYGPDRHLSDKDMQIAFKSLQTLSHPYIAEILTLHNLESGAFAVRKIHENTTIKDLLYGTEYSKNYSSKYGNPKVRKPFTMGQVSHYGHQILVALMFLHDNGLAHGHLHPGNIAIENQKIQLLDIENILLGGANRYKQFILELRHSNTLQAIDVYCFGHTLYEMAFAMPLDSHYCDTFPSDVYEDLDTVLRLCLSSTSCKHGVPTISEILGHPFFTQSLFNGITPKDDSSIHLKLNLTLRAEIQTAFDNIEAKLKAEQKLLRGAKREVRIQEILNSEDELRKHKRRAKKRESMWKSTSSLGDAAASVSASTASSPTPPVPCVPCVPPTERNGNGHTSNHTTEAPPARSALLDSICNFDKSRLSRINAR